MTDPTPVSAACPCDIPQPAGTRTRLVRALWLIEDHAPPAVLAVLGLVDLVTGSRAGTDVDVAAITAGLAGLGVKVAGRAL